MIVMLDGGPSDGLMDFPAGTSPRMILHHHDLTVPPSLYVRTGRYDGRHQVWEFAGERPELEIRDWVI